MKKKGFTLVELLAVIVILAIILAIAIPSISNLMNSSTKNAFESDAKMLLKQIDYKMMEDSSLIPSSINETNIDSKINIPNNNYQTVSVSTLKGKPYVVLVGKNKWDGLVAYGIYTDIRVTEGSNYSKVTNQLGYDEDKGANEPKLAEGMTPIKWDSSTSKWVDTSASDTDWYSYDTTNGVKASTTGNIYGIYDLNGGSWEYQAAYVNNANSNLGQGSSITSAASQYKDVYPVGGTDDQATNYGLTINFKGDGVYESSNNINGSYSWFGDYSYMPYTGSPWFEHGGYWGDGSGAGAFAFIGCHRGGAGSSAGFRPVLAVNVGL